MAKHMPLSIFRHRPSAQVAPLQSLTLSVDIYNLTLAIIEVKHFYLSALHQSLDTLLPVKHCNLKYEISRDCSSITELIILKTFEYNELYDIQIS